MTRPLVHSMCEQKTTRVRGPGSSSANGARTSVAPVLSRDVRPEDLHAAVLRVAEQHLVAGRSDERADRGVQRRARVRREDQIVGGAPTYAASSSRAPSSSSAKRRLERQELDRLPLELALEPLVRLEDRPWARAERAVVQVRDAGSRRKRSFMAA